MSAGRLIAVVGPSGAGKDTLIAHLLRARPDLTAVRRVITRPAQAGGEDHIALSPTLFEKRRAAGGFCLHWQAHGLSYGIPAGLRATLAGGQDALVNLSRAVLPRATLAFADLVVLHVSARPDTLARRLSARNRENAADIAARVRRAAQPLPPGLRVVEVDNDGPIEAACAQALAALYPVRA